jgi:hypothetical protein
VACRRTSAQRPDVNRDIVVKCNLNAEEYVGLAHIADEAGLSQSAMVRQLIKREIASHATRVLAMHAADSPRNGQD